MTKIFQICWLYELSTTNLSQLCREDGLRSLGFGLCNWVIWIDPISGLH